MVAGPCGRRENRAKQPAPCYDAAMGKVKVEFINLRQTGAPLNRAAAFLAAYHHARGQRVLILAADDLMAEELDRALWIFDPASFVPHATTGGPDQGDEPVLIATDLANPNRAGVLILAQAPQKTPLEGFGHVIQFVPPTDGPELAASRERYRVLKDLPEVELLYTTSLPRQDLG